MTREEIIEQLESIVGTYEILLGHGVNSDILDVDDIEAIKEAISALSAENKGDLISRQAVDDVIYDYSRSCDVNYAQIMEYIDKIPSVENKGEWIPVYERLPKKFRFVNCTCHSLIDDREDWVVETVYVPQPSNSPYSDWGNIPMLNDKECEVIAWMYREIPEPYKAEKDGEE